MWLILSFKEIKKFESVITDVNAMHIIKVTSIFTVTAKAEHIPKIWSAIGLFSIIGVNKSFLVSLAGIAFISSQFPHSSF